MPFFYQNIKDLFDSKRMSISSDRATEHCETIYQNLVKTVDQPYFKDAANKEVFIAQLRQQIDYIYSRRYGKKRIG